jgi:thymidine kinase
MYAGKTTELERRVGRARIGQTKAQVFKPKIDNRFSLEEVVSHDGNGFPATPIENPEEILTALQPDTQMVAIDEVQFFPKEIVSVVQNLLAKDICVLVAGLSQDFRGEPFGFLPTLLALADEIAQLSAICTYKFDNGSTCGKQATKTQRIIDGQPADYHDPVILLGAQEAYEARCPQHHLVPGKPA